MSEDLTKIPRATLVHSIQSIRRRIRFYQDRPDLSPVFLEKEREMLRDRLAEIDRRDAQDRR